MERIQANGVTDKVNKLMQNDVGLNVNLKMDKLLIFFPDTIFFF